MQIELRQLRKTYGPAVAVAEISATIAQGKMLALLGPSGCGKTTTLRMVAGFIAPSSGSIHVGARDITTLPAHKRDTGLVFQSYALFPHLSAAENIAFGLRRRGVARAEREQRVTAMLDKLKLSGLAERLPRQLSGGQQQRVAVARALVINPSILLLDEPFSNLDAKLREGTGLELSRLQRELGLTSIFVTHDQSEAMSIADTIAVMKDGVLQQIGSASEIYEQPANRFVAEFIGRANFLPGRILTGDGRSHEVALDAGITVPAIASAHPGGSSRVEVLIRPEAIALTETGRSGSLMATVEAISYQGATVYVHARLADGTLVTCATTPESSRIAAQGDAIGLQPARTRLVSFPI
ncbi:putative spermidine/putrescine transport system ATP-binding protein [Bosea sp. OK403]|uniref:ABC transporter ATP-binding protein n=1 Tax=Bosea sp. OK403 TaxID=1855286 RepID=UPI0008EEA533|nr:ABC transporter ATP-binding protein [Bosea sp. OK403]SFJ53417.1 putative spermidine/putrescine transport system ATP-binding protein [Bosea sp. OK403]